MDAPVSLTSAFPHATKKQFSRAPDEPLWNFGLQPVPEIPIPAQRHPLSASYTVGSIIISASHDNMATRWQGFHLHRCVDVSSVILKTAIEGEATACGHLGHNLPRQLVPKFCQLQRLQTHPGSTRLWCDTGFRIAHECTGAASILPLFISYGSWFETGRSR